MRRGSDWLDWPDRTAKGGTKSTPTLTTTNKLPQCHSTSKLSAYVIRFTNSVQAFDSVEVGFHLHFLKLVEIYVRLWQDLFSPSALTVEGERCPSLQYEHKLALLRRFPDCRAVVMRRSTFVTPETLRFWTARPLGRDTISIFRLSRALRYHRWYDSLSTFQVERQHRQSTVLVTKH